MTRGIKETWVYERMQGAVRMIVGGKNRTEGLEGGENVHSVINGGSTWMAARALLTKKLHPEFIEATRNFLNANAQEDSQEWAEGESEGREGGKKEGGEGENLGNWFGG